MSEEINTHRARTDKMQEKVRRLSNEINELDDEIEYYQSQDQQTKTIEELKIIVEEKAKELQKMVEQELKYLKQYYSENFPSEN